jgi:hypothetical protein
MEDSQMKGVFFFQSGFYSGGEGRALEPAALAPGEELITPAFVGHARVLVADGAIEEFLGRLRSNDSVWLRLLPYYLMARILRSMNRATSSACLQFRQGSTE